MINRTSVPVFSRTLSRRAVLLGASALSAATFAPRWAGAVDGGDEAPIVLRPAPAMAQLLKTEDGPTAVWGYNGGVPGPVLRTPRGKPFRVRVENGLDQPTSVHWHGIRLANAMDGVPGMTQDAVAPGGTQDVTFTPPDAGTYWYHPHHRSWEQQARGLYGALIIEEDEPPVVDQDIVLLFDDWRFGEDKALHLESLGSGHDASHGGRFGNWLTINGTFRPTSSTRPGARVRLRLINTATARVMTVGLPEIAAAWVMALDGQPLASPEKVAASGVVLAPAQRADLIVDVPMEAGRVTIAETTHEEPYPAAFLAVAGDAVNTAAKAAPAPWPTNTLPEPDLDAAREVPLLMEGGAMSWLRSADTPDGETMDGRALAGEGLFWAFNGVAGKPKEPLVRLERGQSVIVAMENRTRWPHAMHLHGHHFRVVARDGAAVDGAPWRDTELMMPGEKVSIALVADNPGQWLFHCHMLAHHKAGMVTWIDVI